MSNEVAKTEQQEVVEAMETSPRNENIFRPLIPDAQRVIRRAMLNGKDQKLAVQVAQDVLDRAGETKKSEQRHAAQVVITDSQVNLLMQAFEESIDEG